MKLAFKSALIIILLKLFFVESLFSDQLQVPEAKTILKCKLPIKILKIDKRNCLDKPKGTLCRSSIEVRSQKRLCGYSDGKQFSLSEVFLTSDLAKKTKNGNIMLLKIEEVQQCLPNINGSKSSFCHKTTQFTLE